MDILICKTHKISNRDKNKKPKHCSIVSISRTYAHKLHEFKIYFTVIVLIKKTQFLISYNYIILSIIKL